MVNVFTRFDPEQIHYVSLLLNGQQVRLSQAIQNISDRAKALAPTWNGDTQTAYLQKIADLKNQGNGLVQSLATFSQNLDIASGIYKSSELTAQQKAGSLQTSGIFKV